MNFSLSLTLLIRDFGLSLLFMPFGYLQFYVRRSQAGLFILLKIFSLHLLIPSGLKEGAKW